MAHKPNNYGTKMSKARLYLEYEGKVIELAYDGDWLFLEHDDGEQGYRKNVTPEWLFDNYLVIKDSLKPNKYMIHGVCNVSEFAP